MNTLSLAPKVSPADVERIFNTHIQDVLLVAYLANTIGTRIDLSNRLASANFGATTPLQTRLLHVPGMNGPNTAGVTGAESPLPRSPLVFGPFMPGTCTNTTTTSATPAAGKKY